MSYIRIHISKHFYYELAKDEYGRETNNYIENDQRSDWSARPKMKLDLSSTSFGGFADTDDQISSSGQDSPDKYNISDVEWDFARGFLGFTVDLKSVQYRYNFLQFEHDDSFQKRPYSQENAQFMNILHVMGRSVNGYEPDLYAAHWDLRKPTRVYISHAPKEHQQVIVNAVYRWNKQLQDIGAVPKGQLAFEPVVYDLKYNFDLRYPSITWFSDKRISMNAPLGVGMAHADVRNGKILWGGIILFGGILERYINSYLPHDGSPGSSDGMEAPTSSSISPLNILSGFFPKAFNTIFDNMDFTSANAVEDRFVSAHTSSVATDIIPQITANQDQLSPQELQDQIQGLRQQINTLKTKNPQIDAMISDVVATAREKQADVRNFFGATTVQKVMGFDKEGSVPSMKDIAAQNGRPQMAEAFQEQDAKKREAMLKASSTNVSATFNEEGLTAENLLGALNNPSLAKRRSYPEILESVVMNLTLHEFGHFMGLGHQFKENIVPAQGSVPDKYVQALKKRATKDLQFSNYTSVMGYMSGRTELVLKTEEVNPGPHDALVLRYLYNGQYATYAPGDADFSYLPVPGTGVIPHTSVDKKNRRVKTAYFPQCNDLDATLGADPFCNRFDQGSSAVDIVNSYFDHLSDNLLTNLYAVVGGGGNSWYAEGRMQVQAFSAFSRVRMFYDEMRRRMRLNPELKPIWNRIALDKKALLEFSNACRVENPVPVANLESEDLKNLFAHEDILDLCKANAVAIHEFNFFLNLPASDFTKIDPNNRYTKGGYLVGDVIVNTGHMFGSWYQLSNLGLKVAALYTLTSGNPYLLWYGWIVNNPFYDDAENRFLYRTVYSKEVTQTIADTVQNNLSFSVTGRDTTTTMGATTLYMGSMLRRQTYTSNESQRIPTEFTKMLENQSRFDFGLTAVIITAVNPTDQSDTTTQAGAQTGTGQSTDGGSATTTTTVSGSSDRGTLDQVDRYKKFTASVYDFRTGRSYSIRDVYLLPGGNIFVWAPGMFIYPISQIKFYSKNSAYVLAYRVSYDDNLNDDLRSFSVKHRLYEKHEEIARICVNGFDNNGLINYFDQANKNFQGFKIPEGIELDGTDGNKVRAFYESVDAEFKDFDDRFIGKPAVPNPDGTSKVQQYSALPGNYPIRSMRGVCEEAIRGIGEITAAAALLNGYWLDITPNYITN
jgi:hypothetical protein